MSSDWLEPVVGVSGTPSIIRVSCSVIAIGETLLPSVALVDVEVAANRGGGVDDVWQ